MNNQVVFGIDRPYQDLGGGVSRRVLAHQPDQMIVEVRFEQDAQGAVHAHPHVQSTYVLSGSFRFVIDGEPVTVNQGDTITFLRDQMHGCTCLAAGSLLDIFTPMREDFL